MGFVYCVYGLCCDFCGGWRGIRKIACPYGYCQAWACCPSCKEKKLHLLSSCTPKTLTHKEFCKSIMQDKNNNQAMIYPRIQREVLD